MQDVVDGQSLRGRRYCRGLPSHSGFAVGQLADVAFNEAEVGPLVWGDEGLHFIEVALVAGGKVVEAHHALV